MIMSATKKILPLFILSTTAIAGMPDQPEPYTIWQGIYAGVDISYNFIWYKSSTNSQLVTNTTVVNGTSSLKKNIDSFAPIGNLGFWYACAPDWLYGLKAS